MARRLPLSFFAKKYPELSFKETTVRHLKNQYQDELHVRQGVPGFKSNLQMDGIRQSFFCQFSEVDLMTCHVVLWVVMLTKHVDSVKSLFKLCRS